MIHVDEAETITRKDHDQFMIIRPGNRPRAPVRQKNFNALRQHCIALFLYGLENHRANLPSSVLAVNSPNYTI
jgi:hypothetical protein